MSTSQKVHILVECTAVGRRVRAHCTCGWSTTPRVSGRRAREALEAEHGYTDPVCALCGRDRSEGLPRTRRYENLRVINDEQSGEQYLACLADDPECFDLVQQEVAEANWALKPPPPRPALRLIRGGAGSGRVGS